MFTPTGWTLLKKLRIRWFSGSKSSSYAQFGEPDSCYTKLLWTIPEEEEDNLQKGEHLIKIRSSPAIKISVGRGAGGDCKCNLLRRCMQLKSRLRASIKKIRKIARCSRNNQKNQRHNTRPRASHSSRVITLAPHRARAEEDELRNQCREIYELHRAIAEGRLSLEKILNLRL